MIWCKIVGCCLKVSSEMLDCSSFVVYMRLLLCLCPELHGSCVAAGQRRGAFDRRDGDERAVLRGGGGLLLPAARLCGLSGWMVVGKRK